MRQHKTRAVVLAAGKSTRFKTKKNKLLFNICGRTMLMYPLKAIEDLNIPITLIVGHQYEQIKQEIDCVQIKNITFVKQEEQLGTGHAVLCARNTFSDAKNILILYGDTPLLTKEFISQIIDEHEKQNATITFLTAMMMDPRNLGRVIKENNKYKIVETKDCTQEQLNISRINAGIYVVNSTWLNNNIDLIPKSEVTGERYLTEIIQMACNQDKHVHAMPVAYDFVRGVNTLQELWEVEQIKRAESIRYWMENGVRFEMAQSIHLDVKVKIGPGSFIGTGVHLLGNVTIGEGTWVGAFTIIEDSTIGDNTVIHSHSVIQDSSIGNSSHVGPFARLRRNVKISDNVEVGNFVEIKQTTMAPKSTVKHISFLGNTDIGKSVNIGAGTVTCNFDGSKKYKTVIEDGAFIGSNNTLIAPLKIHKDAYTAGGSTITTDVPANNLAIGRGRQANKKDYVQKMFQRKDIDKTKEDEEPQLYTDASGKSESEREKFNGAVKSKNIKNIKPKIEMEK